MSLYNQFVLEIEEADKWDMPGIEARVKKAFDEGRLDLNHYALLQEELQERVTE